MKILVERFQKNWQNLLKSIFLNKLVENMTELILNSLKEC